MVVVVGSDGSGGSGGGRSRQVGEVAIKRASAIVAIKQRALSPSVGYEHEKRTWTILGAGLTVSRLYHRSHRNPISPRGERETGWCNSRSRGFPAVCVYGSNHM